MAADLEQNEAIQHNLQSGVQQNHPQILKVQATTCPVDAACYILKDAMYPPGVAHC